MIFNKITNNPPAVNNPEIPQIECTICLDPIFPVQTHFILACTHIFHRNCIAPWLEREGNNCPNCRANVAPEIRAQLRPVEDETRVHHHVRPLLRDRDPLAPTPLIRRPPRVDWRFHRNMLQNRLAEDLIQLNQQNLNSLAHRLDIINRNENPNLSPIIINPDLARLNPIRDPINHEELVRRFAILIHQPALAPVPPQAQAPHNPLLHLQQQMASVGAQINRFFQRLFNPSSQ